MKYDTHFVVWILFNVAYAVYASGWASFSLSMIIIFIEDGLQDVMMDWSLLQRRSPHPFLRPELLYNDWFPVSALGCRLIVLLTHGVKIYYVAIVLITHSF